MVENFPELMKDSSSYRNSYESQPIPSRVCIERQNTRKKVQKTKVNKKMRMMDKDPAPQPHNVDLGTSQGGMRVGTPSSRCWRK